MIFLDAFVYIIILIHLVAVIAFVSLRIRQILINIRRTRLVSVSSHMTTAVEKDAYKLGGISMIKEKD